MRNEWSNYYELARLYPHERPVSATIIDDINSDGHVLDTSMNLTTGMACTTPTALTPGYS
jgi:hypothetical protein